MIQKLFAVFDVKTDLYSPVMTAPTVGHAKRLFAELVQDKTGLPGKYPADYKLVELGTYNDETGGIQTCELVSHGFGVEYVRREDA